MTVRRQQEDTADSGETRVARLFKEYQQLRHRYGILVPPPELGRVEKAVNRREARRKHLLGQIAEIEDELHWLESEIRSFDKGRELLLVGAIDEIRRRFKEAWSPTPVLGYRMWAVRSSGFYGVREKWDQPALQARCLTSYADDEVPHTDGRCGTPPCGIYAAKSVDRLLESTAVDVEPPNLLAVGLVGLSSKVVEHRHGYRGGYATVLALALVRGPVNPFLSDDQNQIGAVFQQPALCWLLEVDPVPVDGETAVKVVIEYLKERERNHEWTSANKNG